MKVSPPLPPLPDDVRAILPESVTYDGLNISVGRYHWSRGAIGAVLSRSYEYDERKLVRELLQNGDRVIETGTGLGLVAMLARRCCGSGRVVCFEANPEMIEAARDNFQRNGIEIDLNNNILVNRAARPNAPGTIRFKVGENFLTSAISPVHPVRSETEVSVVELEEAIAKHQATVLILDIEGDERNLLSNAELAPIRMVIAEIHFDAIGCDGFRVLVEGLAARGLEIDWPHVRGSTFTFRRGNAVRAAGLLTDYMEARTKESEGDAAAAALQYARLAEREPKSLHLTMSKARCLMAAKEYAEAASALECLVNDDASDPDVLITLGVALWRLGNSQRMELTLRRGIARGTRTPTLWALLGRAMHAQNKLHGALNCFLRSIDLNPTIAAVYNEIAKVQRKLGKPDDAAASAKLADRLGLAAEVDPAAND